MTVSTRLDEKTVKGIEEVATEMNLDRGGLIRKYILEGFQRSMMKKHLNLVKSGELSMGQAAENAGVTIYQLLEFAREMDMAIGADASTLDYEIGVLKRRMQKKPN